MERMSHTPRRAASVLVQKTGDELIMISIDQGEYYSLNEVGARIWELCDGEHSIDQIVATLIGEFDEDPSQVDADARGLIDDLIKQGLLLPNR